MEEVYQFLNEWTDDSLGTKPIFKSLVESILNNEDIELVFNSRPGISYSLRGIQKQQKDRPLFVMIDVIDDDPNQRWLSVCFYDDMITDPNELGDLIPGGLLGSDGYCFDITESDENSKAYVGERIQEAYESACNSNS
jgi:hypothetical protein